MLTDDVKKVIINLGADLCGVASIDRFDAAPSGFHPCDVFPACKSVVVFAKRFPVATKDCKKMEPYTIARNRLSNTLDEMAVEVCARLEGFGIAAVPTSTIHYDRYDKATGRMRGIVSLKHSAVAAGLGRIGRNTLVTTPEYGNMVWLNSVLTDANLEADDVLEGDPCPEGCGICKNSCPVNALDCEEMNQDACFRHAFYTPPDEEFVFKCHLCRTLCPNCVGSKNIN